MPTEQNLIDISSHRTASGVSWGSIFAGASAAGALSLILLILGVGLGFSVISPWSTQGVSASTLGASSILWLIFTQIAASGMGGYLAGRLRVKWATVHTDEVYFRDTAHGFLAWAIASLAAAVLFGAVVGSVVSKGISASSTLASSPLTTPGVNPAFLNKPSNSLSNGSVNNGPLEYTIDSLFRSTTAAGDKPTDSDPRLEAERIFVNALRLKNLPAEDRMYMAQVIAKHTDLSVTDAEQRVNNTFTKTQAAIENAAQRAKELADRARKTAAYAALWMFVALLSGAFVASFAATFGGRQRDAVIHTDSNSA